MRIGVDIRVLGTGRASGIEEYTEQLLAHMIPLEFAVQWKLFYSGRAPLTRRSWMEMPNVKVYETGMSNRALWLRTRLTGRPFLDTIIGGVDVFFFPHFLLGALSPSCRRVMTWHDLSYERMPQLLSWHRRRWHDIQMRPRAQVRASDRIIAVSRSTADDLTGVYGIAPERIAVVHSGTDPLLRRPSEQVIRQWCESHDIEGPFILALGTREPRKNLPALVAAWNLLRRREGMQNMQLVIAGQSGWMEQELMRSIRATRTPGMVKFLDRIDRAERPLILSAASVLAYPSLLEGFGFPPLEAMACGTPVVAGATSSVVEVIGDAGLLVDPYRIEGITAALEAVLLDAGLRSRLIAKGYERVTRFSWPDTARQTLQQLRSVVY
ncbi:MAG: glycosyltransferase family 1 protein [Patescibacteria group bacterium]